MASTASNRTQRKRTTTKIFSLSESDPYALVFFYLNDQYKIVKYADVLSNKEGEVELRNADIALLMMVDLFLSKKNRSAFQLSFFLHLGDLSSCRSAFKSHMEMARRCDDHHNEVMMIK